MLGFIPFGWRCFQMYSLSLSALILWFFSVAGFRAARLLTERLGEATLRLHGYLFNNLRFKRI